MNDDERDWLNKFLRINVVDRNRQPSRLTSQPQRKGPHRLGRILDADKLAVIVTNRRARAGLKPTKFSR